MALQRLAFGGLGDSAEARALKQIENKYGRTVSWGAHRSVSAATTLKDSDDLLLCDTTSAGFTVTLPPADLHRGRRFTVKKVSSDGNTLTLDGDGSELIDGVATKTWTAQYGSRTVYCDGTGWHVVASV